MTGGNGPFPSYLLPLSQHFYVQNHSFENEFCLQVHFHANQTHFHNTCFAQRLCLKQSLLFRAGLTCLVLF